MGMNAEENNKDKQELPEFEREDINLAVGSPCPSPFSPYPHNSAPFRVSVCPVL